MNSIIDRPLVSPGIESRRIIKDGPNKGKAHIKIWVTFIVRENGVKKWKQRPFQTGLFCTVDEFNKLIKAKHPNKLPTTLETIRNKVDEFTKRAAGILNKYPDPETFKDRFLSGQSVEEIDFEFKAKIEECRNAKPRPRISSAEKYQTALTSLKEFFQGTSETPVPVTYSMCTPEKLQEYEDWYTAQPIKKGSHIKKSLTSVGINMRHFKHIYKRAIKRGVVDEEHYPFGMPPLYVIPEGGDDTKKFLDTTEKNAFINWRHATSERYNELHDYALFSYYGNGMNMSDVARLTKDRVFKDHITINRQKTKGKKKKNKLTVIPLHPVMRDIITRRGNKSLIPDDYVFPILTHGWDEEKIFYRIRKTVDEVNEVLSIISKEHNFEIKPTSYTLRHTFSFHFMQQEGATTEDLQDALAHGSIKTTEAYKHGFSIDRKKKFSDGL